MSVDLAMGVCVSCSAGSFVPLYMASAAFSWIPLTISYLRAKRSGSLARSTFVFSAPYAQMTTRWMPVGLVGRNPSSSGEGGTKCLKSSSVMLMGLSSTNSPVGLRLRNFLMGLLLVVSLYFSEARSK